MKHFNYNFLRNAFRTALLNEMESIIGPSFKKIKSKCYTDHKQGFYVYAKPNLCDPKTVIKYIGRYLGRPVIATSRIDKYDGDNVTFHYNRHEDGKYIEAYTPDTAKLIPNFTVPFLKANTVSIGVLTNGELPF